MLAAKRKGGEEYLKANFPPSALADPLIDSDYLIVTAASKSVLPEFLEKTQTPLSKKDYFQIAEIMHPDEIHPEVTRKLDEMAVMLNRH